MGNLFSNNNLLKTKIKTQEIENKKNKNLLSKVKKNNKNLRIHVKDLTNYINILNSKYSFSKEEIEKLKKQLLNVRKLEENKINKEFEEKKVLFQKLFDRFLLVKQNILRLLNKIKELHDKNSEFLNYLDMDGKYSKKGYCDLIKKIHNDEKIMDVKITTKNIDSQINILNFYSDDLLNRIYNDYEDLSGKIRIFIRIYNEDKKELSKNKSLELYGNNYGPFFDIFEQKSNKQVFEGLKETINQVKTGYNIVLFGYGYSGSGKTFTLLGDSNNLGLLDESLIYLKNDIRFINCQIQELYGKIEPNNLGRITLNYDSYDKDGNIKRDSSITIQENFNTTLKSILDKINKTRIEKSRIKYTMNNPNSSRSHLFINLSITFKDEKTGTLTFIDMAGVEDPYDLSKMFMRFTTKDVLKWVSKDNIQNLIDTNIKKVKNISKLVWSNEKINKFLPSNKQFNKLLENNVLDFRKLYSYPNELNSLINNLYVDYFKDLFGDNFKKMFVDDGSINYDKIVNYVWDILSEGFFINETINHLKIFFNEKIGNKITFNRKIKNHYILLNREEYLKTVGKDGYDTHKLLTDPYKNEKKIMMTNILKKLNKNKLNQGKINKPTKFIMLCTLKPDLKEESEKTLLFANQIKST